MNENDERRAEILREGELVLYFPLKKRAHFLFLAKSFLRLMRFLSFSLPLRLLILRVLRLSFLPMSFITSEISRLMYMRTTQISKLLKIKHL